jgi:hypothetical protein
MQSLPLVRHVLRDEALTRGLGDVEARMIVEWLVDRVENLAHEGVTEEQAWEQLRQWCRWTRSVTCFVRLWESPKTRANAVQLAAAERVRWPLPSGRMDTAEVMERILAWENRQEELRSESNVLRMAS